MSNENRLMMALHGCTFVMLSEALGLGLAVSLDRDRMG